MGTTNLLAFVVASTLLILIPGPSLLFAISRALTGGRRVAVLSAVGNGLGMLGQVLLVAAGVGALVTSSAVAYAVVKYAGAAYLVWLGVSAIRTRRRSAALPDVGAGLPVVAVSEPWWKALRAGAVVGLTNPKTAVFMTALLPQFVAPEAAHPSLAMIALGAIFVAIGITSDSTFALAAGAARDWFGRSPRRMERLTGSGGVAMVGLGVGVAVTGNS